MVTDVNWDAYEVFVPLHVGLPEEFTRKQAKEAFNHLMEALPHRIEILASLLAANGIQLGYDDESIQCIEDWFREHVESDPEQPERLKRIWYSVVNDIGLFLGEVFIRRHPHLRWELFTGGKTNIVYQRHVIMGFTRAKNPKFNVDTDGVVAGCGYRAAHGTEHNEPGTFLGLLKGSGKYA